MDVRPLVLAAAVALIWAAPTFAAANLVPNGGFESRSLAWSSTPAGSSMLSRAAGFSRTGSRSLAVRVRRRGTAGAVVSIPADRLRDGELYSPVTGTLDGTFRATLWIRATGAEVGRRLRVQLNEFGGLRPEEPLPGATASVRLDRAWERVVVAGRVRRDDRSGVALLAFFDRGRPREVFYVDDVEAVGKPPERGPPATAADRWTWWMYALVWAVVLGTGAAWVVFSRRAARKTAFGT